MTGTIRGAVLTALHKDVQGGSSITQQYVKNILVQRCENKQLDVTATAAVQKKQLAVYEACYNDATKVDPVRKLKEMRYAIGLEKEYTKNQILQSYLNIALFGGRVYGVQSAASYYFGVSAKALNLQQAATLVAILNNPDNLRIDQPGRQGQRSRQRLQGARSTAATTCSTGCSPTARSPRSSTTRRGRRRSSRRSPPCRTGA